MNTVKSNFGFENKRKGVGERINMFEAEEVQTVGQFNILFDDCPMHDKYDVDLELEIGDYIGGNRREIFIAGERIEKKMYADLLYGIDRDIYHLDEQEKELTDMYGYAL